VSSKPVRDGAFPELDFRRVRSVMETPILDDRKWAKLPGIAADAFIIDLEDSVVPDHKERARELAVQYLQTPEHFGDRLLLARPNNLDTPWGADDIAALAEANVRLMLYPKARSAAEILEVRAQLSKRGATPLIFPIIETAGGLLQIDAIAQLPGIGGLFTGIGDLSVDAGIPFYAEDGEINPVLSRARDKVVIASAAARISSTDTVYARNLRDPDDVRAAVLDGRRRGFTSLVTFYPAHVDPINALLPPSQPEVAAAYDLVEKYRQAQAAGKPALVLDDGRTVLLLDYVRAQNLLNRAASMAPTRKDTL
jgi:citrate lyase beta subunit